MSHNIGAQADCAAQMQRNSMQHELQLLQVCLAAVGLLIIVLLFCWVHECVTHIETCVFLCLCVVCGTGSSAADAGDV